MLAFLRTWILNIVTVIVFITFLEILLPNSDMKKYIRMIVGILVMLVILNPILELFNGKIQFEEEVFKTTAMLEQKNLTYDIEQFQVGQEEQIIDIYKTKIINHLRQNIESKREFKVVDLTVSIIEERNHKDFGKLKEIYMVLAKEKSSQDTLENIHPVSNIQIMIGSESNKIQNDGLISNEQTQKIKEEIALLYDISPNSVIVEQENIKNK